MARPRFPRSWLNKPIEVMWLDHVGHGPEWRAVAGTESLEPATFTTVGYLLSAGPVKVVLGSTLDVDKSETGDVTVLVRSCITGAKLLISKENAPKRTP